jgi:alpha-amylase
MIPICLAVHAHLPWRLRPYNYFDVGRRHDYFDAEGARRRLARADELSYAPAAALLERLLDRHPRFSCSLALSGPLLDHLASLAPHRLASFRRVVETGRVEPLGATSHHCLSAPLSTGQVEAQLRLQSERVRESLGRAPAVLGGEEPWDAESLGAMADACGLAGMLIPAGALPPGPARRRVYRTSPGDGMAVLLREDLLSVEMPVGRVSETPGEILCVSVDLAIPGPATRRESGALEVFEAWVEAALARPEAEFLTASEVFDRFPAHDALPAPPPSAGQANEMQRDARVALANLEGRIGRGAPQSLIEDFRRLTSSDNFEAMALRAGDRREQAGTFESPYEAYMAFRHVVSDLERRLDRPRSERTLSAGTASA